MKTDSLWWEHGTIYQIYPRSFYDSNGDGIGDLQGIRQKLDYLQWLGVDALWLSPIYPSPMADFGYDISNYVDIEPIFGTLADFDELLNEVHRRGLKLILDFVPNHTSDQHPWFQESRRGRTSPKRDWYIWRDPHPQGGVPNNWLSNFGGSAWEFDEASQQYYYHAFLREQPDLNWRNPEVQQAMQEVLRFWLDRGVDGFRVDVIWHIIKDEHFRDNPINPQWQDHESPHNQVLATYSTDRPEVHDIIGQMRQLLDSYPERMMVGEIYLPVERLVTYYGAGGKGGAHLPFNFQLIHLPWHAQILREAIEAYEAALPESGWPNWVLGNHDNHRIASRLGEPQARVATMLLLTLRGTPTLYYGDELGMHDVPIAPDQVCDPYEKNVPGLGLGRDPERTPMQWSAAEHAGFSRTPPWLPVAADFVTRNVERQQQEPSSILQLTRQLLRLRKNSSALAVGSYQSLATSGDLLAYLRTAGDSQFLIVLNLGRQQLTFTMENRPWRGTICVSTKHARAGEPVAQSVTLDDSEGLVIRLTN
jgi:alpha-glucosidase